MKIFRNITLYVLVLLTGVNYAQLNDTPNLTASDYYSLSPQNQQRVNEAISVMINPVISSSESMLESAIVTKEDGTKEKHTYTYTNESFGNWATYLWQNSEGNAWSNYIYFTYSYDANGRYIEGLGKTWNNNEWSNMLRYRVTYIGDRIASTIQEMWLSDAWAVIVTTTTTYDDANNLSIEVSESSFMGMVSETKETTTYDANDNIISEMSEELIGADWTKTALTTYEYNSDNTTSSEQTHYWSNEEWQKEFLYVYSYDGNKNRILDLMKLWDGVEWVNSDKFDITFDSNNYMILNITSIWNGSDWQNYHRFSYNYSQDGNSFQAFSETWDSNSWLTEEGEFHFFDTKGYYTEYATHGQSYLFDGTEISANYTSTVTDIVSDNSVVTKFSLSQNYPNPFNPSTTISFALPEQAEVKLSVYNSIGEEVAELLNEEVAAGFHTVNFNAGNLSSGLYFYKITYGNHVKVNKMMLLK